MSPEIFDTYKDDHRQNCENVSQPAHIFVCFSALPHVDQIFFLRCNGNIFVCHRRVVSIIIDVSLRVHVSMTRAKSQLTECSPTESFLSRVESTHWTTLHTPHTLSSVTLHGFYGYYCNQRWYNLDESRNFFLILIKTYTLVQEDLLKGA